MFGQITNVSLSPLRVAVWKHRRADISIPDEILLLKSGEVHSISGDFRAMATDNKRMKDLRIEYT